MSNFKFIRRCIFLIVLLPTISVGAAEFTEEDIIGQWKNVVKNPTHKNTVSKLYMMHTFFNDGNLAVENKEDSQDNKEWKFNDGIFTVTSSYKSSKFIEKYKLININELSKIRFRSIIDGKPLADYNPKEKYIRQGSSADKNMKTLDIFKSVKSSMDFIDPNTLKVGSKYILSKKTPIMPHYTPSDLSKIIYALKGQPILIIKREKVNNTVWYRVTSNGAQGWVNSIALFGQKLK